MPITQKFNKIVCRKLTKSWYAQKDTISSFWLLLYSLDKVWAIKKWDLMRFFSFFQIYCTELSLYFTTNHTVEVEENSQVGFLICEKIKFICKLLLKVLYWKLQGVPIENCQKQMAVDLKRFIFEPMLVKPKCVWEAKVFLKNLPPLKRILVLSI